MAQMRDAIMAQGRGQVALTDGELCDALIALIDSSSRERVNLNLERIRLLTRTDGALGRTERETLILTTYA